MEYYVDTDSRRLGELVADDEETAKARARQILRDNAIKEAVLLRWDPGQPEIPPHKVCDLYSL